MAYVPVGSHNTVTNVASAVTLIRPAGAVRIFVQAFTQNVRLTFDGSIPSATRGFQLAAGEYLVIPFKGIEIQVIEEAASASVQYQWFD